MVSWIPCLSWDLAPRPGDEENDMAGPHRCLERAGVAFVCVLAASARDRRNVPFAGATASERIAKENGA